jgi:hypothetical protein
MDEEMEWAFKEWERNLMEKFVAEWRSHRMRRHEKKRLQQTFILEFQKLCGLFSSIAVQFVFANGSLKRRLINCVRI